MNAAVAVQVEGTVKAGVPASQGAIVSANVAVGLKRLRNATTGAKARMDSTRLTRPSRAALPRWCGQSGLLPQPVEAYPDTNRTFTASSVAIRAQAEPPLAVLLAETAADLWFYRSRTIALLRRYSRASIEVGRLPSLMGRECFRSRLTSYSMRNFEDIAIFVHDMEQAVNRLQPLEKKLIAMHVLEEYTQGEIARLLGCTRRWIEFQIPDAIDALTRILLEVGLIDRVAFCARRQKSCQEGKNGVFSVSDSYNGENKS